MKSLMISSTELRIQSMEDGLSHVAGESSVPSSSSAFLRKIEFHPARKPVTGFGNSDALSCGSFRIETLNSDSAARKRPLGLNSCQSGKTVDMSDVAENGPDPELSFGITFRRIGAGLENLGNTCFLNSVLQCLTYTEPLAAYLQSGKHQNSCHVAGFCALCAIQKHVSRALQSTGRSLVPKDLVSNLRCISRNFRNARQEDAHEYMVNLLESMHKCCLPSGVPSESPAAYEKSLVHKIFGGRLRSQVECQQCLYCSNKFDPFLDLSLEIVKADTLPVALRNFTASELLDGGEKQYQCQRCKQKVKAKKRLTVHKAPYVLTIHLKRFHAHDPGRKVDKKVLFDRSLDMKPFVSGSYEGDLKYSLYGVLVHFGHNTHSGHYVCFVRTSSGVWYLLNDNEVRQVSEKRVLDQKAYMLFYVRDRKNIAPRKPVDVVQKENVKAVVGSNLTNLVVKRSSKEHADNGSVGSRSSVTSSTAVNQKDALNVGTSKEILQKETSNRPVISECVVTRANPGAEPSSSPLLKDPSKEVSPSPKANRGAEPSSSGTSVTTAKVDNATVTIGFKLNDCNQAFSKSIESQNTPIKKLDINEASEKINPILNGRVDGTMARVPRLSLSVNFADRMSNKIDDVKSPNKPSGESSQGGGFLVECAAGNALGDQAGSKGQQILNELVGSALVSVEQNGCRHNKAPDFSPHRKIKKKLLKCRIPNLHLGKKFFRASIGLRKKKKHRKSKCYMLKTQNLMKEQLLENNSFSSEVGPSTSQISFSAPLGVRNLDSKKGESCLKNKSDSLIKIADEGFEKRNNQKSDDIAIDKQFKKTSCSLSETHLQDAGDFAETSKKYESENGIKCMLTRGLEETAVACWDGLELPPSQMVESCSMGNLHIGYVPDEWDEEYDRGKRKKLRHNKHELGGPNPFQEFASQKKQFRKAMVMERFSYGNKPFRI